MTRPAFATAWLRRGRPVLCVTAIIGMTCAPEGAQRSSMEQRRMAMVDHQIQARGVKDPRVLAAMREVPRERFVPKSQADRAHTEAWEQVRQSERLHDLAAEGYVLYQRLFPAGSVR